MNSKNLDNIERRIDKAQERYAQHWGTLGEEERQLANKLTCLTEYVGGRTAAAALLGVAATTIDNYRMGKTQPKYLEMLKLAQAADLDVNYLLLGSEFEALKGKPQQPEVDESYLYEKNAVIDADLLVDIKEVVASVHKEAGITLRAETLDRKAIDYYNQYMLDDTDLSDVEEMKLWLGLLEKRIRREVTAARDAPGTGKHKAS